MILLCCERGGVMAAAKSKREGIALTGRVYRANNLETVEVRRALVDMECATYYHPDDPRARHGISKGELCVREFNDGTWFYCRKCRPFMLVSELL